MAGTMFGIGSQLPYTGYAAGAPWNPAIASPFQPYPLIQGLSQQLQQLQHIVVVQQHILQQVQQTLQLIPYQLQQLQQQPGTQQSLFGLPSLAGGQPGQVM